jgi:hypothetical protein
LKGLNVVQDSFFFSSCLSLVIFVFWLLLAISLPPYITVTYPHSTSDLSLFLQWHSWNVVPAVSFTGLTLKFTSQVSKKCIYFVVYVLTTRQSSQVYDETCVAVCVTILSVFI